MKKTLFILFLSVMSVKAFAQTDDGMVTEEKASAWVKVTNIAVANPVRSATNSAPASTRTATRASTPKPTSTQAKTTQPKPAETFNKTNQKVKRFKKN
jgi:hypothetical protein